MHQLLKDAITKFGKSELEFFQYCYLRRFNKVHNCVSDLCAYKQHAVIPVYVRWVILSE